MDFVINHASVADLATIYQLFEEAIWFQKENHYTGWKSYDKEFIQSDIQKGFLFKIVKGETIVCIFSICHSDALIWREREKGDAVYLHRTVVNQQFKGERIFQKVLDWAIQFAKEKQLKFIRMDTWADNQKIIDYYRSYGFLSIETYTTPDTKELPEQHRNLKVTLLEFPVKTDTTITSAYLKSNEEFFVNTLEKVNIHQELSTIHHYWSQKIIGLANGQLIKLAKGKGEIQWHKHDDQDELFILYKGHLTIQLREKNIELFPNELFIVPKGVEHCPIAHGDTAFLIMGLNITSNTAGGRPLTFLKKNHSYNNIYLKMKIYFVDAFTNQLFSGNSAAICMATDSLDEHTMQNLASEIGFSETAFVFPISDNHYQIRFFTPKKEIPLCGHATLAASKILFETNPFTQIRLHNIEDIELVVDKAGEKIKMQFPVYDTEKAEIPQRMLDALGIDEVITTRYNPENRMILIEIADTLTLKKLTPDFTALVKSYTGINGVLVTAKSEDEVYDFHYRYFWPWAGTNEDPVTGAVQTFLTKYWSDKIQKSQLRAFQSSARTGVMDTELLGDHVFIYGEVVIVFEGVFNGR